MHESGPKIFFCDEEKCFDFVDSIGLMDRKSHIDAIKPVGEICEFGDAIWDEA